MTYRQGAVSDINGSYESLEDLLTMKKTCAFAILGFVMLASGCV